MRQNQLTLSQNHDNQPRFTAYTKVTPPSAGYAVCAATDKG